MADLNKENREPFFDVVVADWDHRDCPTGDSLQKDIFGWLSAPDPWKNHEAACKSRHRGTADWFIQGNTFSDWITSEMPSSLLWVHGKRPLIPGFCNSKVTNFFSFWLCSGSWKKRLLVRDIFVSLSLELIMFVSSTIIEDIRAMRKAGLASLAFFYCDFRDDRKKELRGLLSSFLVQLYHQSDSYFEILSKFYSEHDKGSRPPSDDELARCLKELLNLPGLAPVYLIVDGMDECSNESVVGSPKSHRAEVLSLVEELVKTPILNLHICVTSRPELDIKDVLDPLLFRSISLHDESGQNRDIEDYIKSAIYTRPKKGRWKEEHKELVIDVLIRNANGMYVVSLKYCWPLLISFCDVGSDGRIVRWSTFATASRRVSNVR